MKNKTKRALHLWTLPLVALLTVSLFVGYQHFSSKPSLPDSTQTTVAANPEEQDILAGKTMVAFGDSVTEFGHYPAVIAENTGMTVHNMGFKGTRLAYHPYSAYDSFSLTKLVDAIVTRDFSEQDAAIQEDRNYSVAFKEHYEELKTIDFNTVDLVSVLIGTNDYMGNHAGVVSLGEPANNTRETFYGAINYFVQTMQENYPHLELVFITPTWRMNHEDLGGESAAKQPNARENYLIEFVDAIIERGDYYDIPTLDLYRTSGLNEENHATFFEDHVHPNDQGFELIGNTVSHFLVDTYNSQ